VLEDVLLNLLSRFNDVEEEVSGVDAVDIRERDLTEIGSAMGLVMQRTFRFDGDIEETSALGDRTMDGDRFEKWHAS